MASVGFREEVLEVDYQWLGFEDVSDVAVSQTFWECVIGVVDGE